MATGRGQRIGIWVIAIVLTVGTLGSFVAMMLSTQNNANDLAQQQKITQEREVAAAKEAEALSAQHYESFKQYQSSPAVFDKASVGDSVATKDIEVGTGTELTADTKYQAYYILWGPDGTVIDTSIDGTKLKAPIDTSQQSLIPGWNQGVVGMKVGGVRELTIPSALAYGEQGSGEIIPPNTPLKFIVKIIATK